MSMRLILSVSGASQALVIIALLAAPVAADPDPAHIMADKFSRAAESSTPSEPDRVAPPSHSTADQEDQRLEAEKAEMLERARREAEARRIEEEAQAKARLEAEAARAKDAMRRKLEADREAEARRLAEKLNQAEAARRAKAAENAPAAEAPPIAPPAALGGPASPPPRVTTGPAADDDRVTVLFIMDVGKKGIRRFAKTGDPVLCIKDRCFVSTGLEKPARKMPRNKALGTANTLGKRADACRASLVCAFRAVPLEGDRAVLQPVDLRILRHDRREAADISADPSCQVTAGALACRRPVLSRTWRAWIVPEAVAESAGPDALKAALQRRLEPPPVTEAAAWPPG